MSDRNPGPSTDLAAHLTDKRLRAVYLSDALATGCADEVAAALHVLQHAGHLPDEAGKSAEDLTLSEVMETLRHAGVQLVAIRRPDA